MATNRTAPVARNRTAVAHIVSLQDAERTACGKRVAFFTFQAAADHKGGTCKSCELNVTEFGR